MFFKLDSKSKKIIAKAVCGKYPPGEIVLRAAYCNFNCIPCFAAGYSHTEKIKQRKIKDIVEVKNVNELIQDFKNFIENEYIKEFISRCDPPEFNWLRVVGGEPIAL
jgi:molybdenum cofactor biosynthesis enzyme MoaA